jgi:nucleotide-binding universal stress UspA family protein
MPDFTHVLVASHGTPGAQAANAAALAWCRVGGRLSHLVVVPDLWRGMMGDDWLNNASTRKTYGNYIESELQREIDDHVGRLRAQAGAAGILYECKVLLGNPTACLLAYSHEIAPALVIIGARRPPGRPGLRSHIHTGRLVAALTAPLLVIPHPK